MEYFVISEKPNGSLSTKCFGSFDSAMDYAKIINTKWSLFQWRGGRLFWLKGNRCLIGDIYVNEILVGESNG